MASFWQHRDRIAVRFRVRGAVYVTTISPRPTVNEDVEAAERFLRSGTPWSTVRKWLRGEGYVGITADEHAVIAKCRRSIGDARRRAKARGLEYSLSPDDAESLLGNGRCAVTGLPFSMGRPPGSRWAPWAPSLDRIDGSKGYSAENCRFVCVVVNLSINQWGEDVFERMAMAFAEKRSTAAPPRSRISHRKASQGGDI